MRQRKKERTNEQTKRKHTGISCRLYHSVKISLQFNDLNQQHECGTKWWAYRVWPKQKRTVGGNIKKKMENGKYDSCLMFKIIRGIFHSFAYEYTPNMIEYLSVCLYLCFPLTLSLCVWVSKCIYVFLCRYFIITCLLYMQYQLLGIPIILQKKKKKRSRSKRKYISQISCVPKWFQQLQGWFIHILIHSSYLDVDTCVCVLQSSKSQQIQFADRKVLCVMKAKAANVLWMCVLTCEHRQLAGLKPQFKPVPNDALFLCLSIFYRIRLRS